MDGQPDDQRTRQLRVALAQVDTGVGDLDGNAGLVTRWARRAQDAGAHLVLFPEMWSTGYALPIDTSFAVPVDGPWVEGFRDIAAELGTTTERVSDEKYKAIRKLRTHLGVDA